MLPAADFELICPSYSASREQGCAQRRSSYANRSPRLICELMSDLVSELSQLADEVQASLSIADTNAKLWMDSAGVLFRACVVDGRLVPHLTPAMPPVTQGEFLAALRILGSASELYHPELRPDIERALSLIVKVLRREVVAELDQTAPRPSIRSLANNLTPLQQHIFEVLWSFYIEKGKPYPIRSLQPILGRVSIPIALSGLNGCLIQEVFEDGIRAFKLTLLGALLTGHGNVLLSLLTRLMDTVRQRYETNSLVNDISGAEIEGDLRLSPDETRLLFRALSLGLPLHAPLRLSGWQTDGSAWTTAVTDDVISLYHSDDTRRFTEELLLHAYAEEEPYAYDARVARIFSTERVFLEGTTGSPGTVNELRTGFRTLDKGTYINLARLAEIKTIRNDKFDCARLIRLCEELNTAASNEDAHSVIMLTRAILNHVPPVFGHRTFSDVANHYSGGTSLKQILKRLEEVSRKIADRLSHMPIEEKEVTPNMTQVNFSAEMDLLLSELCRRLK